MRYIFSIVIVILLAGCGTGLEMKGQLFNDELISSKGEKIYVSAMVWGVTADHQRSSITANRYKLTDGKDTANTIEGLEPFQYSFSNDTLILAFRKSIDYAVTEKFKTIKVVYRLLPDVRTSPEDIHGVPKKNLREEDW